MCIFYIHSLLKFAINISGYRELGVSVSEQTVVKLSGLCIFVFYLAPLIMPRLYCIASIVDESIRIENLISITGNGNIGVIVQLKGP